MSDHAMEQFATMLGSWQAKGMKRTADHVHPELGQIYSRIVDYAGDVYASEIEYTNEQGEVMGYWAYGHFDPRMPYAPSSDE